MSNVSPVKPGDVFGHNTVIEYSHNTPSGSRIWKCQCECGEIRYRTSYRAKQGFACGCRQFLGHNTTHGATRGGKPTHSYKAWRAMKERCGNPNNSKFDRYGGRGIKVCARWLGSYENFHADMGDPPTPKHTLDRRDNDGDYCPENCAWATRLEQGLNRSNTRWITFNGQTLHLTAWAAVLGLSRRALRNRLEKWSLEKAMTTPKM